MAKRRDWRRMKHYAALCELMLVAADLVRDPTVKARYLAYASDYSGLAFRLSARGVV